MGHRVPCGLANGMFIGYANEYLLTHHVTWLETVCAPPFWTSMIVFRSEGEPRGHMMHEHMFQPPTQYKYKSNVFSVPMPWEEIFEQMTTNDQRKGGVALPHDQGAIETMVHLCLAGGSLNLARFVSEFVVRQRVVLDLCEMLVGMKHPDVTHLSREEMRRRAAHLPKQGVPEFVTRILEQGDEDLPNKGLYANKNATPAEPPASGERAFQNLRPTALLFERHSDTLKDTLQVQTDSLGKATFLRVQTGKA